MHGRRRPKQTLERWVRSPRADSIEALACGGSPQVGDRYGAAGADDVVLNSRPRAALQRVRSFDAIGSAEDRWEADDYVAAGLGNAVDF